MKKAAKKVPSKKSKLVTVKPVRELHKVVEVVRFSGFTREGHKNIISYVDDGISALKEFDSLAELNEFILVFTMANPDMDNSGGSWLNYVITDIAGEVHILDENVDFFNPCLGGVL